MEIILNFDKVCSFKIPDLRRRSMGCFCCRTEKLEVETLRLLLWLGEIGTGGVLLLLSMVNPFWTLKVSHCRVSVLPATVAD